MKTKYMALLLLLVCLLSLPLLAMAGPDVLVIGDTSVWSLMAHDFPVIGDNWVFDGEVLTLTNCTINTAYPYKTDYIRLGSGHEFINYISGLYFGEGDLTIKLVGENTIITADIMPTLNGGGIFAVDGIVCEDGSKLTIIGDGSLTVKTASWKYHGTEFSRGILVDSLVIGNGKDIPTVTVQAGDLGSDYYYGASLSVGADLRTLTMNSGIVNLMAGTAANSINYTTYGLKIAGHSAVKKGVLRVVGGQENSGVAVYCPDDVYALLNLYDCAFIAENPENGLAASQHGWFIWANHVHHRWRHGADDYWRPYEKPNDEYFCSQEGRTFNDFAARLEYQAATTVSFKANGGSGTMDALSVFAGETATLPECGFTAPAGKEFSHWELNGVALQPGATFDVTGPMTFTAVWKATSAPAVPATGDGTNLLLLSALALMSIGAFLALRRRTA